MILRSIWHMVGKGVAPLKIKEDNIVVWFHPRSLFCVFIPNLFERVFLFSALLRPQSRASPEKEEAAEYPSLRWLAM